MFFKSPVKISAIQLTPDSFEDCVKFVDLKYLGLVNKEESTIFLRTMEGTIAATIGDWIIKGIQGEFYPCKDSIFRSTYRKPQQQELCNSVEYRGRFISGLRFAKHELKFTKDVDKAISRVNDLIEAEESDQRAQLSDDAVVDLHKVFKFAFEHDLQLNDTTADQVLRCLDELLKLRKATRPQ
jgi:hypothetical protein